MNEGLLNLRRRMKAKKPEFLRQDSHKKKKLGKKWRRPKGIDSKMRLKFRGYRKSVSKGYKSPREVRGLHRSGLKMVLINSKRDLKEIDKGKEGVIFSKNVGLRKKIELVKECEKEGIKILNVKDSKKFLQDTENLIKERKEERKKAQKEERRDVKKKVGRTEEKEEKTEEEKKEEEKKEKDKILTKKQ